MDIPFIFLIYKKKRPFALGDLRDYRQVRVFFFLFTQHKNVTLVSTLQHNKVNYRCAQHYFFFTFCTTRWYM